MTPSFIAAYNPTAAIFHEHGCATETMLRAVRTGEPLCAILQPVRAMGTALLVVLTASSLLAASCTSTSQATTPAGTTAPSGQPAASEDPRAYYDFMLGYQAELSQDTEQALRRYLSALQEDPSSRFLKARIAALYFARGDVANAVQFAEQLRQAESLDPSTLVLLANIYAGAGEPEKALNLYDHAIAQDPSAGGTYISKGLLLVNLRRLQEAERAFQQGAEKSKESPAAYYYLGRIAVELNESERAIPHFERAITVSPTFEPAYISLAAVYESQQDRAKAVALYRKYLQDVNARSKEIRHNLVRLYIGDKLYAEALAELGKLLADDPDDLDAQLRVALIHGEQKDYQKSVQELTKILAVRSGELRVRDYLGLMYEELKRYDEAIRAYEQNLKIQPAYVDGHVHLGFLLYRLKRYNEAIPHLADAARLNPKRADAHLLLGLTYLQIEQYDRASKVFEEGIRYNPANPDLYFNLGTAYDKLNRFDDVVTAMEAALRLDPKHADALNYLGYSYAERGIKIDEALSLIQRAVALKPNNGYYVDSLGWVFFKKGLLNEALVEIKKAAALVGDDPVIFEHLGEIYLEQNLVQEGREAWIRSLELDPNNQKLMDRFRHRGLGDPAMEERIRQAKRRLSQNDAPDAVHQTAAPGPSH